MTERISYAVTDAKHGVKQAKLADAEAKNKRPQRKPQEKCTESRCKHIISLSGSGCENIFFTESKTGT